MPADEAQADEQAESRMRQSLDRLGSRRPVERTANVLANRPRRHAFVQDGQVIVEQARRRPRNDAPGLPPAPEPATGPDPSHAMAARLERADRAMRDAQAAARALETRLGHLQLELEDTARRLRERDAAILQLRQDEARTAHATEALRSELEALRREARKETRATIPAEAPDAGEPEPVKWWLPASAREMRPRRG